MLALVAESQSKLNLLRRHARRRVVNLRRVGAGRQDRRRGGQHPAQVVGTNAQVLHLVRAKEQAAAQIYGAGADGKHHWKRRQHQKLSEDGTMRYGWRSKDIKRCVMMVASAIDQDWVQIDSEGIVNFCLCVFSLRKTVGFVRNINLRRQLIGFFQIRSAAPPEIILTLKLGRSDFGPSTRFSAVRRARPRCG